MIRECSGRNVRQVLRQLKGLFHLFCRFSTSFPVGIGSKPHEPIVVKIDRLRNVIFPEIWPIHVYRHNAVSTWYFACKLSSQTAGQYQPRSLHCTVIEQLMARIASWYLETAVLAKPVECKNRLGVFSWLGSWKLLALGKDKNRYKRRLTGCCLPCDN